jgi:hypothetical protein
MKAVSEGGIQITFLNIGSNILNNPLRIKRERQFEIAEESQWLESWQTPTVRAEHHFQCWGAWR